VAEKVCVFPRRSEAEAGVMVTVMDEGGGGGGGGTIVEAAPAVLPAQPAVLAATARRATVGQRGKTRRRWGVRFGANVGRERPHGTAKCRRSARGEGEERRAGLIHSRSVPTL
jgi:hypothetical protein